MILIGLGSNISGPWGSPTETLERAVSEIEDNGIKVVARSKWIETKPYGKTDQPGFINGVIEIKTRLAPESLLVMLHQVEVAAGRKRREKWGPRTLDLDIVAYNNVVMKGSENSLDLTLPHGDLHNRSFVLLPLQELDPSWQHPVSGKPVAQMLDELAEN